MKREQIQQEQIILPTGYTQLQYIKSTGTQYINTGFTVGIGKYSISFDFDKVETSSVSVLFATGNSGDSQWGCNPYFFTNTSLCLYVGVSIVAFGRTNFNLNEMSNVTLSVDVPNGVLIYDFTQNSNEAHIKSSGGFGGSIYQNTLTLFAAHRGSTITQYSKIRCYSCKIYQDDTIVRDFIPALRDSDSKPGLYDIVNGVFYTNAGSGEFLYA